MRAPNQGRLNMMKTTSRILRTAALIATVGGCKTTVVPELHCGNEEGPAPYTLENGAIACPSDECVDSDGSPVCTTGQDCISDEHGNRWCAICDEQLRTCVRQPELDGGTPDQGVPPDSAPPRPDMGETPDSAPPRDDEGIEPDSTPPAPDMAPDLGPDAALPPDAGVDAAPIPECETDTECDNGLLCLGGNCSECTDDEQCGEGIMCDERMDPNQCVQCLETADCGTCTGTTCFGGSCVTVPGGELCDGRDNDCNGQIDDGFNVGDTCTSGVGACARSGHLICAPDGLGTVCDATPGTPSSEICDGADNDCDGAVDEAQPVFTTVCGVGGCERNGELVCLGGVYREVCTPGSPEASDAICDMVDNDCNGETDEDYAPRPMECGIGACRRLGLTECVSGEELESCVPGTPALSDATCNMVDEDCNGTMDEDYLVTTTTCGVGGCASTGIKTCVGGTEPDSCRSGTPSASDAICNGIDSDCNGFADEDYVSETITCGVGACLRTVPTSCVGGIEVRSCTPGTPSSEICDGADNDCDGAVDEGTDRSCYTGPSGTVGVGICRAGTQTCASGLYGACTGQVTPATEVCGNTLDDDCDGSVNEGCPTCGDGTCNGSETCSTCASDCGVCPPNMTISMVDAPSTTLTLQTDITASGAVGWASYPDDTSPFSWNLTIAPASASASQLYRFNMNRLPQGDTVCKTVAGVPSCIGLPTVSVDGSAITMRNYSASRTFITSGEAAVALDPRPIDPTANVFYCRGARNCEINCSNGLDDDGDGRTDRTPGSADPDCQ